MSYDAKYNRLNDASNNSEEELSPSHVPRRSSRYHVWYSLTSTVLIIILATIIAVQAHHQPGRSQDDNSRKVAWGSDQRYMSLEHQYDHLWEALDGQGSVFNLSDADNDGAAMPAVLSMFHQLHCLSGIRKALQQAREGHDPGIDASDNGHWPHCFDYLRKTIMCWADDTIERKAHFSDGRLAPFIDGSQDLRQCGPYEELVDRMTEVGKSVTLEPFP